MRQADFRSEPALGPESGHDVTDGFAAAYPRQREHQHIPHGERLSLPLQPYHLISPSYKEAERQALLQIEVRRMYR